MSAEDLWRAKPDRDLLAAASRLDEYTELGQQIILAEMARRELTPSRPSSNNDRAEGLASSEVAEPPTPPSVNPLGRLWRGEFSLPAAYWGWGVLGRFCIALLASLLAATGNMWVLLVLAIAEIAYMVTVYVGIWRSANRYGGNRVWGDLAKVSIGLGIVSTIGQVIRQRM